MDKKFIADRVRDTLSFVFPASSLQVMFKNKKLRISGFAPYFDSGDEDARDQIIDALMKYMPDLLPEVTLEVDVKYGHSHPIYNSED